MKIVVIYRGSERDEPFDEIDGVWNSARLALLVWFRAESKWTRKRTYVQILRSVCCLGVRLFFDDWAGGHNGPAPDHFLRTMGGRRIRIPRNATWLLQAADHHTSPLEDALEDVDPVRPIASDHHTYFQTGVM
jgi:hypothetical protein